MSSVNDIRATFLDYFRRHDHAVVASGPLVPAHDPTLMFTNAGMVPFKNIFTGRQPPPHPRATSSQKCLRAGGKHNDLDNVGYTHRHHTFFEMLGHFSFGDYFKERAILLAWNFLTKDLDLTSDKLLVTVYADDDEAYALWQQIAMLPEERLLRIASDDNFWSMGETGPCGPCSEIFYDHGPAVAGGPPGSADAEGDRFVEIWNLVFMQYEIQPGGLQIDLPRPSIDTGMGLERIAAVLQGVHDNYAIDLFQSLIKSVNQALDRKESKNIAGPKVIADHLRACGFLIAEGILPSNEGRGYVLRRIMRRAMRHARQLGASQPLMPQLVPALISTMGKAFPELGRSETLITETLRGEEERFYDTLERGLRLLDDEITALSKGGCLSGTVAFKLYDTYGFPVDLTADILREHGLTLDQAGFDAAMDNQKATARAHWKGSGEEALDDVWVTIGAELGPTEFCGYHCDQLSGELRAILSHHQRQDHAEAGNDISLIVNQTPFYAESGGQRGDRGMIKTDSGAEVQIIDTRKQPGGVIEHIGRVVSGTLRTGETVLLSIDTARRAALCANHSATHLLHAVLRRQLGSHVTQRGSLVAPDRLRFDISHSDPLGEQEMGMIQSAVNRFIRQNSPVETRIMAPDEAISLGAMALFGEKYGLEVRVVSMGYDDREDEKTPFSLELCGGTHVRQTGDIGFFLITGEQTVGAGLRRLEALTGSDAEAYLDAQGRLLNEAARILKVPSKDVPKRLQIFETERKQLEKDLTQARRHMITGHDDVRTIADITFAERLLDDVPPRDLKSMADEIKQSLGAAVVALVSRNEGKASLVVAVDDSFTDRLNAIELARAGGAVLGGKGGGRPDMAQAGGPHGDKAQKALEAIAAALEKSAS